MTLKTRLALTLDQILAAPLPARLGLAVSGGGDSMALMHLAHGWAAGIGKTAPELHVVTVDHGLRQGSAAEAGAVADAAAALGLPHDTLRWTGWDGTGNLQDAARRARAHLIGGWARDAGIETVLTGHTQDDQAETVLLRLARGSGVDGLAGMRQTRRKDGICWARPLLDEQRAELRAYLCDNGLDWIEDPSNDDPRFDRVRARRMLEALGDLGLSPARLAATAAHMQSALDVLDAAARDLSGRALTQCPDGTLRLQCTAFLGAPEDTRKRLLAQALMWIAGQTYRPRHSALAALADSLAGTLHGAQIVADGPDHVRIVRELGAVAALRGPSDALWDGRWRLDGPHQPGLQVAALGEAGLSQCPPGRPDKGEPRAALLVTPAIWQGATLRAAPLAGFGNGWRADLVPPRDDFNATLIFR